MSPWLADFFRWRFGRSIVVGAALVGLAFGPPVAPLQYSEQALEDRIGQEITLGHVGLAYEEAREAVKHYPNSSLLQQLLGVAQFKKGLNDEARQAFRRAIELDPSLPQNYYNLALVDLSQQKYDGAAASLEKFLRFDPSDAAEAHLLLGRAYQNLNRTEPAIEQFRQALALSPRLPLAHYHLGFAYQSQGNRTAAVEEFQKEMQDNPGFCDVYWLAGNIELERGDLDLAEDLFRKGIRIQPQSFATLYGLARVFLARQRLPDAETQLLKALEQNPNSIEAHYTLARTYQQMGRSQAAQQEFDTVASLHERQRHALSGIAARH